MGLPSSRAEVSERRDLAIAPLLSARARWLALNVFMLSVSILCCLRIADALFAPDIPPRSGGVQALTSGAVKRDETRPKSRSGDAYEVIVARNLFNPDRGDPTSSAAARVLPPPPTTLALAGVAISDDTRVAFVQDLGTNHIAGYKTGDTLAGGRVERIESDRVVIMRADGPVEVMLHRPKDRLAVGTTPEEVSPRRSRGRQE